MIAARIDVAFSLRGGWRRQQGTPPVECAAAKGDVTYRAALCAQTLSVVPDWSQRIANPIKPFNF
jgi:hypothetical protein